MVNGKTYRFSNAKYIIADKENDIPDGDWIVGEAMNVIILTNTGQIEISADAFSVLKSENMAVLIK